VSRQLITEYRSELDRIHAASGSKRESVVREAFKDLLKRWGKSRDLIFLAEHEYIAPQGDRRYIDGALVHSIRVPFGYWEAKDTNDDLDEEIRKKTAIGYPRNNIIYEDTNTAVLIQNKREVARAKMEDTEALFRLLELFFAYERPEIADFRKAVRQFAADLPAVLERLREIIAEKRAQSREFARAELKFLDHAREAINPAVTEEDVQEMLIQHILTEDIFAKVFDNPEFHRKNNVAAELYKLEEKLFGYGEKSKLLAALRPYYVGIESTASLIESHSEKQGFLKGLYENFYRVYNPLAADRLGVVYTPGEIVRFMIRSADWLCHKHFDRGLDDRHVEILDPATGTGTFIVELLEHFRGNRDKLDYKYREELHANEVAILPYYVANLNIEATYHAITGRFAEFPGLVFVDTLDNVDALGIYAGHQHDLLGTIADENAERIKRQNRRKISVIIGNPPYNANQQNENQNNKNREYERVDARIRQTYAAQRSSHKTKIYDPYVRFIRWASDRLGDEGILAFVVNRSFVDKRAFDGFRRSTASEFSVIYVVDLFGDVRDSERRGGNVFPNTIGTAIIFLVKSRASAGTVLISEISSGSGEDKLTALGATSLSELPTCAAMDASNGDWGTIAGGDQGDSILLVPAKLSGTAEEKSRPTIFKQASFGFVSNRDDWTISRSPERLREKLEFYLTVYNSTVDDLPLRLTSPIDDYLDYRIKWTDDLRRHAQARRHIRYSPESVRPVLYRPYSVRSHYHSPDLNWSLYRLPTFYPTTQASNETIYFSDRGSRAPFTSLAADRPAELHLAASTDGFQGVSRYRYSKSGECLDNITDWAVKQFQTQYGKKAGVTKDTIFAYCYAVLHDPLYREKFALNLKREFPRIPFNDEFARWAGWGQQLLNLHIGYERAKPFKFTRVDTPNAKRARGLHPKPKLKSEPDKGLVIVDEDTQLTGIPREAWDYRLGNRSAIDWVLDQHKEKAPRDPTVREKFNTYRFADYKESMIDLLARVITVSLETVKITDAMKELPR
jgi:predicted helicase